MCYHNTITAIDMREWRSIICQRWKWNENEKENENENENEDCSVVVLSKRMRMIVNKS
jgi:hypothetical protein